MSFRSALSELASNFDDRFWLRERIQDHIAAPVLDRIHGTGGFCIPEADWDTLIVYDACRADMFEQTIETNEFDAYRRVVSRGSSSPDWLQHNFAHGEFGDTVCVTANPWTARIAADSFHDLIDVWQEQQTGGGETALEHRDLSTSPASTVEAAELTNRVHEVADRYPNKRYLVHFFQPHAPCIGNPDGSVKPRSEMNIELHPGRPLEAGRVEQEEVWRAYRENLQYVHTHGRRLAEEIGGKTVFTADHGELFGERLWPIPIRGYAHPEGIRHPSLVEVPWAVCTVGGRRTIESDDIRRHDIDEDAVEKRLQDLGYV